MEIIEIGAVLLDEYGSYIDSFERYVRPTLHPVLSNFCMNLTHISQIDINRADTFQNVLDDFWYWADLDSDEEYWLCSWGGFDKRQLIQDCTLHKLNADWVNPHLNIKQQYQHMKRLKQPIGLKKAVEREGFDFTGEHHRALADSENLAKIFYKYLDSWQL
jgi:3'-5' exoribonuclease 1